MPAAFLTSFLTYVGRSELGSLVRLGEHQNYDTNSGGSVFTKECSKHGYFELNIVICGTTNKQDSSRLERNVIDSENVSLRALASDRIPWADQYTKPEHHMYLVQTQKNLASRLVNYVFESTEVYCSKFPRMNVYFYGDDSFANFKIGYNNMSDRHRELFDRYYDCKKVNDKSTWHKIAVKPTATMRVFDEEKYYDHAFKTMTAEQKRQLRNALF